jgi:hypothetical protein
MTLGDGIFASALVLSIVGLYIATRDRWRWRRIAKWAVGVPVVLVTLLGAGGWAFKAFEARPRTQSSFGSISLRMSEGDVRFAMGEPAQSRDGRWVYYAGSGSAKAESAGYVVRFKDGKVRYVAYTSTPEQIVTPYLLGFTIGSPYDHVVEELGAPDHVSTSTDGLRRMVSYKRFNTFFAFQRAQVTDLGVYDPATGPMEFGVPAPPVPNATEPASSASQSEAERWQRGPEVRSQLDHCSPGISKAERLKRLAQYGTVREVGNASFEAGGRTVSFHYDGALLHCQ